MPTRAEVTKTAHHPRPYFFYTLLNKEYKLKPLSSDTFFFMITAFVAVTAIL